MLFPQTAENQLVCACRRAAAPRAQSGVTRNGAETELRNALNWTGRRFSRAGPSADVLKAEVPRPTHGGAESYVVNRGC